MWDWALWSIATAVGLALIAGWLREQSRHLARLARVPIRVHVNGIRGKSTITRYIAAALNAGGLATVAKTTGSATRLIAADGTETPVHRIGAPTILEQVSLLARALVPGTDAMVVECMALDPEYQRISETRMIRATDGIIANVRHDHTEQLGDTLPAIARSLASTVPRNGVLYTAVQDEALLQILRDAAFGEVVQVSPADVSDRDMDRFGPMEVAENVALALAVARRHGVPRDTALRAMVEAGPDPGASAVERIQTEAGTLHWVDLFSVNDVASASKILAQVRDDLRDLPVVLLLNTRSDRTARSADFSDWIGRDLPDVPVVETGDATDAAAARLRRQGADESGAFHVATHDDRTDLVRRLLALAGTTEAIAVGLANIHSTDAARLRDRLEDAA